MRHRHLDVAAGMPVPELGLAALDDLLDRGDLDDWAPVSREIHARPWGAVAKRVLHLANNHPMYGTSALWRTWIADQRKAAPSFHSGAALRRLRLRLGLTQAEVARRLDMTQPEISKLERRGDARVSTMRAYAVALGGTLTLVARFEDEEIELESAK